MLTGERSNTIITYLFERKEVEVVNFGNPYKASVPLDERCEIVLEVKGCR